ncbi:MAG TPA: GerMN domain-containing protein [Pyrinomonadaceae bacterium]
MRNLILISLLFSFAVNSFGQKSETMTVKLYFLNEKFDPNLLDCTKVHPVTRQIPKTKAIARAALDELFKGVTPEESSKGYVSFSAEETKGILKSIKIKNKAAYINFNKVVYEQLGSATTSCGGGFFTSVEKTLFQFPTIKKIFYAIEGNPADFYEWVQVGECPKELKNCSGKDF